MTQVNVSEQPIYMAFSQAEDGRVIHTLIENGVHIVQAEYSLEDAQTLYESIGKFLTGSFGTVSNFLRHSSIKAELTFTSMDEDEQDGMNGR